MIYITGDTHGLANFAKLNLFAGQHPELTKDDYLIIAGDFGGVIESNNLMERLRFYMDLPFTVLFVDGNHENFDLLETFPIEEWKGGKIRRISKDIIHLMRGQVFEIEGNTIFTLGGATSIDREGRTKGVSWWPQEVPTREDLQEGMKNLAKYNYKVDYIVTHTCSNRAAAHYQLAASMTKCNCPENTLFDEIDEKVKYKHWYFGHFHIDCKLSYRYTALLEKILKLGEGLDD